MAKAKTADGIGTLYPHIDRWVYDEGGWVEVGPDDYTGSFIRVLNTGGMVWEGEPDYPTLDAAFRAADAAIAEWLDGDAPPKAVAKPKKKPAAKRTAEIRLTPVESSMLSAVGYDAKNKELIAVFNSGAMWRYSGVTRKVYNDLLASSSKGSFMRSNIIGLYPEHPCRR